jgi:hypothetical protein
VTGAVTISGMNDADLEILETIIHARGGFGHREHLELAWNYLNGEGTDAAHRKMARAIRVLAVRHGTPEKYHETITRTWVHLVALHRANSRAASFDEFIAENPGLLDSRLLGRHYSRESLGSAAARAGWVSPDLRPLPASV